MHRFSSRSDESADLTRRATEAPANVLSEYVEEADRVQRAGRADDFVAAVENLCIIRAVQGFVLPLPAIPYPKACVHGWKKNST